MENLKKNWLVVWIMKWAISQIFTGALKSLKIGTLKVWDWNLERSYMPWQWRMIQNSEKELTCRFVIDMSNLTNFDPSTRKSQKFAL